MSDFLVICFGSVEPSALPCDDHLERLARLLGAACGFSVFPLLIAAIGRSLVFLGSSRDGRQSEPFPPHPVHENERTGRTPRGVLDVT